MKKPLLEIRKKWGHSSFVRFWLSRTTRLGRSRLSLSKGDSSAVTAIMLAERRGDETAHAYSTGLCGNYVDVGRHEQKNDNRADSTRSAMVHAVVLHRRPRASAATRRFKSGRCLD